MKMATTSKPELIQLFENLLWIHSPKDWILKSTYSQGTLCISMLIEGQHTKIHRSFAIKAIHKRSTDLWGLAADCIDEMKSEITKKR